MVQTHYLQDKQLGDTCCINGESSYLKYNADLESVVPLAGSLSQNYIKRIGKNGFMLLYQDVEPGGLKMIFYVGGMTRDDCDINCSRLIADCKDCIITIENETFEYVCVLTKYDIQKFAIDYWNIVTLEFIAIKRLPLVTWKESLDLPGTSDPRGLQWFSPDVYNVGTVASGIDVFIRMKDFEEDALGLTIYFTDTLDNYGNPPDDTTQIFMEKGTQVNVGGISGNLHTYGYGERVNVSMINFPKIQPGQQFTIGINTMHTVSIDMQIKFYPIFMN